MKIRTMGKQLLYLVPSVMTSSQESVDLKFVLEDLLHSESDHPFPEFRMWNDFWCGKKQERFWSF